jgi:hypothetical protein
MQTDLEFLDIYIKGDLEKMNFEFIDDSNATIYWDFSFIEKKSTIDIDVLVKHIDLRILFRDFEDQEIEKEYTFNIDNIELENTPKTIPISIQNLNIDLNKNLATIEFN